MVGAYGGVRMVGAYGGVRMVVFVWWCVYDGVHMVGMVCVWWCVYGGVCMVVCAW